MEFALLILSGAGIGFIIGLTGVGGGALMTPLLLLYGYPVPVAIGTDLLFAAVTKSSGLASHAKLGHVNWPIVGLLALGSLPSALLTGYLLHSLNLTAIYQDVLTIALGVMLILTATVLFLRHRLKIREQPYEKPGPKRKLVTVLVGAGLGGIVTLTSVGAGAVGTTILVLLFPWLIGRHVVGTDIAHAVPLTFLAGLVHLQLGQVDLSLLVSLLIGSVPAIYFGARLTQSIPQHVMMPILATLLFTLGLRYAFF